jgi:Bor protein
MTMRSALALSACLLLLTACYRTHYENFSPNNPMRNAQQGQPDRVGSGWQHFFLFGWVPTKRTIDARQRCGGAENVHSIQTRETFLQGLIAEFAGYYINIYSPWTGEVYCTPPQLAPPP